MVIDFTVRSPWAPTVSSLRSHTLKCLKRNTEKTLMSLKPKPKLKAKVLNPKRTRRKKFSCSVCSIAKYSAKDYKILFEAKKIIYFNFPSTSNNVYCHECLFKEVSRRMKPDQTYIKLLVEDIKESYILSIEKDYYE